MAALTALAIAGAAMSAGQAIAGGIQKKKANEAAEQSAKDLKATISKGLVNQFAGLQVPTEEFDMADQKTQAVAAGLADRASDAGPAGVIGSVGSLVGATHEANLKSAIGKGKAVSENEKLIASEQSRIDQVKYEGLVGLDKMKLDGAQAARKEGADNMAAGFAGLGASAGNFALASGEWNGEDDEDGIGQGLIPQ